MLGRVVAAVGGSLWLLVGWALAESEGEPLTTGLLWSAALIWWVPTMVIGVLLLTVGGAACAAAGFAMVREGRRIAGGIYAVLAVLHGGAWQAATVANWNPADPLGTLAVGGLAALPLLAGLGVLAWIARGGGLDPLPMSDAEPPKPGRH